MSVRVILRYEKLYREPHIKLQKNHYVSSSDFDSRQNSIENL